jgi:glycosyltransferase involved in cell wall biosynthesis
VIASAYPFGDPVVATTVGNIPTQVDHGQTGYLVPPNDPDALADRIVEILSDDQLQARMSTATRNKANTDLSWDRMASLTTNAYEKTIETLNSS